MSRTAGIRDSVKFSNCLVNDKQVSEEIRVDSIAGVTLGVTGTPVILVNEWRFDGYPGRSELERYISNAIKASQ